MPNATLAAVVIAYSVGLLDPAQMLAIRRVRTMEFRWAVAACLGVMVLGTLHGILAAIVLSMAGLIARASNRRVDELGQKPGTHLCVRAPPSTAGTSASRACSSRDRRGADPHLGNAANVAEKLRALATAAPRVLLLDFAAVPGLEYTALKMLVEAEERLRGNGVDLWLAALNPEALELVRTAPGTAAGPRAHACHRGGRRGRL